MNKFYLKKIMDHLLDANALAEILDSNPNRNFSDEDESFIDSLKDETYSLAVKISLKLE